VCEDVELAYNGRYLGGRHDVTDLVYEKISLFITQARLAGVFLGSYLPAYRRNTSHAFKTHAPQLTDQMPCRFREGIADMFRYDIFGTEVWRFIFRYIGDYLATSTAHGQQESSHETVESAQEISHPMSSLKVDRSRIDGVDPQRRGKTTTSLIEVVRL